MKTQQEIIEAVKNGRKSGCEAVDGRDYGRLVEFFPSDQWSLFGFSLREGAKHILAAWTEENIKRQLESDVSFGFEKALHKRGISAGLMYEVVKMWMWVLDDPLQYHSSYAMYGLPLFKAVAVKYGFPNPIGDDSGSEQPKYGEY
jgi:hypothetical protein